MSAVDELEATVTEPEQGEPAIDPEHGGEREPDPADDDDETPDGTEPDVQDAPPAGPTPEQKEAAYKKVEKSFDTYRRAVERELPDESEDLTACPLCSDTPAGFVNVNAAGTFPPEVCATIDLFLGRTREADYPDSKDFRPCPDCDALGKVKTGSKVPQRETLPCPRCNGQGYVDQTGHAANGRVTEQAALSIVPTEASPAASEDADFLGSPRLLPNGLPNPNFGLMPQYRSPEYP